MYKIIYHAIHSIKNIQSEYKGAEVHQEIIIALFIKLLTDISLVRPENGNKELQFLPADLIFPTSSIEITGLGFPQIFFI